MHRSSGLRARSAVAVAAAAALALSVPLTSSATAARPDPTRAAAALAPAGPDGPVITVDDQAAFSGVDMATDPSTGTAYLGWISSNYATQTLRAVHLCVLPPGASSCAGGVLTTSAVDGPSAAGLQIKVTAPGVATLVWFHQLGLTEARLATATYANGVLSGPSDLWVAPSNGRLLDVTDAGNGQLWAVTQNDPGTGQVLHLQPLVPGAPYTDVVAPWYVGHASLAFAGSKAVLLVGKYGSIGDPLYFASGAPWTAFAPVPKTWTLGEYSDLVTTKHGVRMIGSEANANYRPVVGKWTGSSFTKPDLIGDNESCPALTHDLVTDGSGRLADVSERCGKLGIYNLPKTTEAAIAKFSSGGTIAGAPQITTTTRGYGWVAWPILSPIQGNRLLVRAVRLPALMTQKTAKEKDNKVTVTGPVSCLPVVTVRGKLKTDPAKGWDVVSKQLSLDGDDVNSPVKINGERLAAGSKHVLKGKAVFRRGGQSVTVTEQLSFKAC
jgi:hypothetical protein